MDTYIPELFAAAVATGNPGSTYDEIRNDLETKSFPAPLTDWEVAEAVEDALEYVESNTSAAEQPDGFKRAFFDDNHHTFQLIMEKNRFSISVRRSAGELPDGEPEYPPGLARALEAGVTRVRRDYRDDEHILDFPRFVVRAGHDWVDLSTDLPTREVLRLYSNCQKIEFVSVDRQGYESVVCKVLGELSEGDRLTA